MNLRTDRLEIVELALSDLDDLFKLESCPEVDEFNTLGIPVNIEVTKIHLLKMLSARKSSPRISYHWKVILSQTREFIGVCGLHLSNDRFLLGEFYFSFHPNYWGNGYAYEVGKRLIQFGFNDLQLHKIEAGVQTENIKSIKVLEKLGMTREGLRRKILPIRGEWKDNFHYAIVEDDPQ